MKKRTLIVAALLAAMTISANAQENLAQGKTATASSEQGDFTADKAVDGITDGGSRWAFSGEDKANIDNTDSFYFQVDLTGEDGKTVDFNSVQIVWENDHVQKFNILTSNDGKNWTVAYEQTEVTDNSGTKSYDFETQNARYIRLKATQIDTYFSFFEFRVFNKQTSVLTKVKPSVSFVELNKETEVSLKYIDQYGAEMTVENADIVVDGGTYADGKLTATKSGKVTFTVTAGGKSVETSVYSVDQAPELALDNYDYKGIYGASELNVQEKAGWGTRWNEEVTDIAEITLGETPVLQVSNLKKILFGKLNESNGTDSWNLTNTDEYTDAKIALFPDRDVTAEFSVEGGKSSGKVALKGGEWNYITASGFTADNTISYFGVLCDAVDGEYPSMLISNIYLQKAKEGALIIDRTVTSNKNFLKVSGKVTADNKAELESNDLADVTAFDLSGVTFADGIGAINFANKNAMIQVAGTVDGSATLAENAKVIEGTRNMVVENGGYYFPVAKLQLADGDLAYTDFFISTGATGYSYTREVKSGNWISIASPIDNLTIPEGLTVYEADEANCDDTTLAFKKVDGTTIQKGVPYLAYATTDVTLEGDGTGDLDMQSTFEKNASLGSATFYGTFASVKGSAGNYYGIYSNATGNTETSLKLQKLGNEAQLGSFRAYVALPAAASVSAYRVMINNGVETSIFNINANGNAAAADGVYSIDGRLVKKGASTVGLAKGVYIVNGKKYVVK